MFVCEESFEINENFKEWLKRGKRWIMTKEENYLKSKNERNEEKKRNEQKRKEKERENKKERSFNSKQLNMK